MSQFQNWQETWLVQVARRTTPKVSLDLCPWVKLLIKHVLCFSSQTHTPEINMSPPSPGSPPNGKQNLCIVNLGTQPLWFLLKRKMLTFTALHIFLKISVWVPCFFPSSWPKHIKLTLARFTLFKCEWHNSFNPTSKRKHAKLIRISQAFFQE